MSHDHSEHRASAKADDVRNFMTDLFDISTAHVGESFYITRFRLILSFVTIFIMGAMYEGVKWFRVFLQMNHHAEQIKEDGLRLKEIKHDEV
uniref:Copper transporter n=1 Tax=Heterorhabditis bacteriophora TaxID=37862 RepID=A0A1I7WLP1_HETBA